MKADQKKKTSFKIAFSFPSLTSPQAIYSKECVFYLLHAYLLFPLEADTTFLPPHTICRLILQDGISQWSSWLASGLLLNFHLIMRALAGNILSPGVLKAPTGITLSHVSSVMIYFASFESGSCLQQARLSCLLGVWGVCGWKTAVNCIDKKPRATIWAAGVQYEGWLIDWDPWVMQAEGHKHTNTQWYLCCTNRRGVRRRFNKSNDFQLHLPFFHLPALCSSAVPCGRVSWQWSVFSLLTGSRSTSSVSSINETEEKKEKP